MSPEDLAERLIAQAGDIVEAELARLRRRVPGLDPRVVAETEATLQRVVRTLLCREAP
ncbi:hypothetical protein [Nonomuraea sediminis]|uniref:hypothetical protein n=1 Tax=Nonomuraea sediminis TaxID=2835864 RepID=UPI001BDD2A74|nr:hypothetical protein [Nonomuraea sediminis]